MADDFMIPVPLGADTVNAMPLDEAVARASEKLSLPSIGGPSGRGWSFLSTAQRCAHLFNASYPTDARASIEKLLALAHGGEKRNPAPALQVGGLYHNLQGLYYGVGLGEALLVDRGLISAELKPKRVGRPKRVQLPPDAADQLLKELHAMADATVDLAPSVEGGTPARRPAPSLISEAERCFDAHTSYWGAGREDVTPLAIEWLAFNEALNYTCRYDMVGALGANDPLVSAGSFKAGDVFIYERKTSAWLSEMVLDGWFLDGEVLGEILNWKPSGCESLFGPLKGVIVDIVTKTKVPKLHQVIIPADLPTVQDHERWIKYTQGEIAMWEATGVYPKRFTQCFDRWGRCGMWHNCAQRGQP